MNRAMVEADLYVGLIVKCRRCDRMGAFWYHQRTSFVDTSRNWVALCVPCREDNDKYWNDQWASYYEGCL
jgi:DNA-directed RNA polymerase subunit M/transcription elongation factor TFIIS